MQALMRGGAKYPKSSTASPGFRAKPRTNESLSHAMENRPGCWSASDPMRLGWTRPASGLRQIDT